MKGKEFTGYIDKCADRIMDALLAVATIWLGRDFSSRTERLVDIFKPQNRAGEMDHSRRERSRKKDPPLTEETIRMIREVYLP